MAEQESSGSELEPQDQEDVLHQVMWDTWRTSDGPPCPLADSPRVDGGGDSSSESSSESSSSSEEGVYVVNPQPEGDGLSGSSSPLSFDLDLQADKSLSAGCTDSEKETDTATDTATGSPGGAERWSTSDGSEHTDECPCCVASTSFVPESKEQSKMVAFFEDPARKRAQIAHQIRERSKRCQLQRQQLLRTAIWNSWCAKSKALYQQEMAYQPIHESNPTDMMETRELPSLPHAVEHDEVHHF